MKRILFNLSSQSKTPLTCLLYICVCISTHLCQSTSFIQSSVSVFYAAFVYISITIYRGILGLLPWQDIDYLYRFPKCGPQGSLCRLAPPLGPDSCSSYRTGLSLEHRYTRTPSVTFTINLSHQYTIIGIFCSLKTLSMNIHQLTFKSLSSHIRLFD